MKNRLSNTLAIASMAFSLGSASSFAAVIQLRILEQTNTTFLTANPVSEPGALFIYQATNLSALATNPALFFQTNTPATLWQPAAPGFDSSGQSYFFAVHFPGRSVGEFGSPEYSPAQTPSGLVLLASGLPGHLVSGQAFTVDFFVTDPAGQLLNLTGEVNLYAVRPSDGTIHPDAQVIPSAQQLTEGHLRAQVSLQAASSLEGYTLGIGPVTNAANGVNLLPATFNLGPDPLPSPTAAALLQILDNNRKSATDPDSAWSCPLSTSGHWAVSGTYGEWRGKFNQEVHTGLDLAAPANSLVTASRGGIVSSVETLEGLNGSIVIDHGDGWFSRYAVLDAATIVVTPGQAVLRGTTLAAGRAVAASGPAPLHFEIRRGTGRAQWGAVTPGTSQDPLQTPGIFSVPPPINPPQLKEIGLTSTHPGRQPFVKTQPISSDSGATNGLFYFFARLVDDEPAIDAGESQSQYQYHLGLRSIAFQADGMSQPLVIQPFNDEAVDHLRIPGAGAAMGFARYDPLHAINPDPLNDYPYWWAWDTSSLATNPVGPRTISLTSQTHDGAWFTNSLSFGPEIKNNVWQPLGAGAFKITVVAHLGSTNLPPQCAQPDQYRLEVLRADQTAMPGVLWTGTTPEYFSAVFSNHLDAAEYTFQIPATENASNMVVRVSSLMAPDLRHEVSQGVVQLLGRASNAPPLVDIPAGTYVMGSPDSEPERFSFEGPQTIMTIPYSFKMGKTAVTQGQYKSIMGSNPSYFSGVSNRPVEQVSWTDATNYCFRLTQLERQAGFLPEGWAYRLPTEAEWEYACRAGTTTPFHYGTALRSGMANFNGHYEYDVTIGTTNNPDGVYPSIPVPVASYAPNAWGLCDMHGNVWEWCQNWWASNLPGGAVSDPSGPASGVDKVLRGGAWYNNAVFCRAAFRIRSSATYRSNDTGFRVVLAPTPY